MSRFLIGILRRDRSFILQNLFTNNSRVIQRAWDKILKTGKAADQTELGKRPRREPP
jgi:hypothetical protein